ncbi:hypothetical protein GCM10009813_20560 [Brevibacterium marinum]|uniref:Acyl-CoA synthetase (AMP-forming)/AMP-acid ligase II n=1 Tax=Brevibacterium marinum TaxID=418643 RepID=A0A846RXL8_9MICO|nr:acyl-CoA synthetase (AMP-forming)/AMP-acid ligase II [Brevibacterium marinum]
MFGLPDESLGEKVSPVVAVQSEASVTVQDLQARVGAELAGYNKPRVIRIRESLGRTPAGQLNHARAKELASDLMEPGPGEGEAAATKEEFRQGYSDGAESTETNVANRAGR